MSAADWTRLQRQRGGVTYGSTVMKTGCVAATYTDVEPTNAKTLRPASDWTNYIAYAKDGYLCGTFS